MLSTAACESYEARALDDVCWAYNDLRVGFIDSADSLSRHLPPAGTEEFERVKGEITEQVLANARERQRWLADTSRAGREYRWRDSLERQIDKHCSGHI